MKFTQHPLWIKKEIICCDCSPLNFIRQVWKMWFQPSFKGVFHKRINILGWVCFFSLYFDKSRKSFLAKEDCWLPIKKVKSLIVCDFSIQECWEVTRKNLLRKRHSQRKNRLHFTLTASDFSAWQGCTSFLPNLKVCTSTKKVDNHWTRWPPRSFANPMWHSAPLCLHWSTIVPLCFHLL